MPESQLSTLKLLKNHLLKEAKRGATRRIGIRMRRDTHAEMRRKLDETLLAFRVARRAAGAPEGWLRAVRQAVGIPVEEAARRLGVSKWEIFRMEKAETKSRIGLGTLRRAAEALDCELVYALAPRQGTLEELAVLQRDAREKAREAKLEKTRAAAEAREEKVLKSIGWRRAMRKALRHRLREEGIRVR